MTTCEHRWYYFGLDHEPIPGICMLCGLMKEEKAMFHHPKGFAEHPVDPNTSTSGVFCNTCLQSAPEAARQKTDAEVWTEIYGSTPEHVRLIARCLHLSEGKVTGVIELAHNLSKVPA